jgi:hypothetical protein
MSGLTDPLIPYHSPRLHPYGGHYRSESIGPRQPAERPHEPLAGNRFCKAASSGSSALWPKPIRQQLQDRAIAAGSDPGESLLIRAVTNRIPSGVSTFVHCRRTVVGGARSITKRTDLVAGPLRVTNGPLRLTWSLTPHSPAAVLTDRRWRLIASRLLAPAPPCVPALHRLPCGPRAGPSLGRTYS